MRARGTLIVAAMLVSIAAHCPASGLPPDCTRNKLSATARAVQVRVGCQAAAVRAGSAVDDGCVQRSFARMSAAFERADQSGPCPGLAVTAQQDVELELSMLLACLPGTGACPARKLTAAGRKVARRLRCQMRDPGQVLECFARSDARFIDGFARADAKGPCGGDAGTIESRADAFASSVGTPIAGPPPSTTSTTSTTVPGLCGNGIVDPGEQCDGQSYCGAGCAFGPTACCLITGGGPSCIDFQPTRQTCLSCMGAGGACVTGVCGGTACEDQSIPSVTVCCQFDDGCATDVAASIGELGHLYFGCAGEGFPFGMGICGVDRICHPGG
jgi:hypothetical protein